MMRLVYKPFGLLFGILGGLLARAVFKRVWGVEKAPKATDAESGWREVVLAAAAEGAVFGGVKALIDRAGASGFAWVTGAWPGRRKD